jgi:hypothetical protein
MIITNRYRSIPVTSKKIPGSGTQKFIALMGQSNATGTIPIASTPPELAGPIPFTKIFDNTRLDFETLESGINTTQDASGFTNNAVFGVELPLMKALGANYGVDQYLFKYARTGTQLFNNNSLCWNVFSNPTSLWVASISRYGLAIPKVPILNKSLEWVVWIQGENDCTLNSSAAYQQNITDFINFTRLSLGLPTLKFILVSLATNQTALNATYLAAVNSAMSATAVAVSNVWYLSQNSAVQGDNTHYTLAGYQNIASLVYDIIIAN